MVVRLIVFLSSANLICRSTDISKCFIESLGVRDNESRLYIKFCFIGQMVCHIKIYISSIRPVLHEFNTSCPKELTQLFSSPNRRLRPVLMSTIEVK